MVHTALEIALHPLADLHGLLLLRVHLGLGLGGLGLHQAGHGLVAGVADKLDGGGLGQSGGVHIEGHLYREILIVAHALGAVVGVQQLAAGVVQIDADVEVLGAAAHAALSGGLQTGLAVLQLAAGEGEVIHQEVGGRTAGTIDDGHGAVVVVQLRYGEVQLGGGFNGHPAVVVPAVFGGGGDPGGAGGHGGNLAAGIDGGHAGVGGLPLHAVVGGVGGIHRGAEVLAVPNLQRQAAGVHGDAGDLDLRGDGDLAGGGLSVVGGDGDGGGALPLGGDGAAAADGGHAGVGGGPGDAVIGGVAGLHRGGQAAGGALRQTHGGLVQGDAGDLHGGGGDGDLAGGLDPVGGGGGDGGGTLLHGGDLAVVHSSHAGVGGLPGHVGDGGVSGGGGDGKGGGLALLQRQAGLVHGQLGGGNHLHGNGLPQLGHGHAGDDGGHRRAGDGGLGDEGALGVAAGEDARPVEEIDVVIVGGTGGQIGNGAVLHRVFLLQSLLRQGLGQNGGKLPAGGHRVIVGKLALGNDAVFEGIVHIDLIPGVALDEVGAAGLIDAVEPAGQGNGGAHGNVAVGGEGNGAGALHQTQLIGGLDVFRVPGAGRHIGKGTGGVGGALLEVGQTLACGQSSGTEGHHQPQGQRQGQDAFFHTISSSSSGCAQAKQGGAPPRPALLDLLSNHNYILFFKVKQFAGCIVFVERYPGRNRKNRAKQWVFLHFARLV